VRSKSNPSAAWIPGWEVLAKGKRLRHLKQGIRLSGLNEVSGDIMGCAGDERLTDNRLCGVAVLTTATPLSGFPSGLRSLLARVGTMEFEPFENVHHLADQVAWPAHHHV